MKERKTIPKNKVVILEPSIKKHTYESKGMPFIAQYDVILQLIFLLQLTSSIFTSVTFLDTLFYFCIFFNFIFLIEFVCSTNQKIFSVYFICRNMLYRQVLVFIHSLLQGIGFINIIYYVYFSEIPKSINNYNIYSYFTLILIFTSFFLLSFIFILIIYFSNLQYKALIPAKSELFNLKALFFHMFLFGFLKLSLSFYVFNLSTKEYYMLLPSALYFVFGILIPILAVIKSKVYVINLDKYIIFTVIKFLMFLNVLYLLTIKVSFRYLFGVNLEYIFYN